ncbi:MAG: imelysin family protein [Roseivirga sp.]
MKRTSNQILIALIALTFLGFSCGSSSDDDPGTDIDNFDRSAMLEHWRSLIITPAVGSFSNEISVLQVAVDAFETAPNEQGLVQMRSAWTEAYRAWQNVSMFEIGFAESVSLRNFMNIYPVDAAEVEENISSGGYNFTLPSANDEQGFPALDYLINGLGSTDTEILNVYTDANKGAAYLAYLKAVVTRMAELTAGVKDYWETGSDDFVQNSGASATASVNKLVNDFIFYYEKSLRAGKVGIPAGVFSGNPLPQNVEAYYQKDLSKTLLLDALDAVQNFFNGKQFEGSQTGPGLKSYLDFLNTIKGGENLSGLINSQLNAARTAIQALDDDFTLQIQNDNVTLLAAYDELQKLVILLKVDMLQALNVQVDFVDADGD